VIDSPLVLITLCAISGPCQLLTSHVPSPHHCPDRAHHCHKARVRRSLVAATVSGPWVRSTQHAARSVLMMLSARPATADESDLCKSLAGSYNDICSCLLGFSIIYYRASKMLRISVRRCIISFVTVVINIMLSLHLCVLIRHMLSNIIGFH
jgi:hypothetical protein